MNLSYKPYFLEFKHPFGVSGNTRKETPTVFVKLQQDNFTGYGEACLPVYLGETLEASLDFLNQAKPVLMEASLKQPLEEILTAIDKLSDKNNAAKAGIDIALHDLYAKASNKACFQLLNIQKPGAQSTSFTIGIDSEEKMAQKIEEAKAYSVLKIKAGTADDKALIKTVRQLTDKPLYVDVNQGWKTKEYALKMIEWMTDKNVVLIEQPLPKELKREMKWLSERSPIPTFADESVKRLKDLEELDGAFQGINIKLMKCTGLNEAHKMILHCKRNKLKILLGCMAESSCGTSAMAQLMALGDFVDLDAPQLYLNDPFEGLSYQAGKIYLNNFSGIGVEPKTNLFKN